ncbi:uncharacterized protein SPAPADRAFT_58195 [Spathaspora passalidarum NRRL Y-27907]|uniref:Ribosomal protein n=1 Tax=Spathaspora passalidarum (strain NRRL Y-27907 / 11-Y1) TaxID=619300 RepID=G3AFS2_SPAPN|nr:uncharacterized protein SPAPADRAFT_58195 [Spathaspora passalidarum NRRL Y-27907]EGW35061.1 hypothetical protein SPAPADRAFT_58195 [Spathaspora passalidarum NRRL Y-27907]
MFSLTSVIKKQFYFPNVARTIFNVTPRFVPRALYQPIREFKVRSAVRKYCKDCYLVKRKGRVYVYCKTHGKHKQRQG